MRRSGQDWPCSVCSLPCSRSSQRGAVVTTAAVETRSRSCPTCRCRGLIACRRSRWSAGSSMCSRRRATRRATTRSRSSRSTTRPPQPGSGTRRSAPRTHGRTRAATTSWWSSGPTTGLRRDRDPAQRGADRDGQPREHVRGLTHAAPGTEAGEPDKYYPRVAATTRVVATDDNQGKIGASFLKDDQGCTSVYILDDKELYGKGVADAFEAAAKDIGLEVKGHEGWDKSAQNYQALMSKIKASGATCIYLGGVSANNGGQLIKDKVSNVGDNDQVKLMASDGFVLSSIFDESGGKVEARGSPTKPVDKLTGEGKASSRSSRPRKARTSRSTRPTRWQRRRSRSTRSAARTGLARTSSRSCSRRTCPTASSGGHVQRGRRHRGRRRVRLQGHGRQVAWQQEKSVSG